MPKNIIMQFTYINDDFFPMRARKCQRIEVSFLNFGYIISPKIHVHLTTEVETNKFSMKIHAILGKNFDYVFQIGTVSLLSELSTFCRLL